MIEFVNAKINIGLQIVGKRPDGYHNLQTVFYPIGRYAGTPSNPTRFCDILELTYTIEDDADRVTLINGVPNIRECDIHYRFSGRRVDCMEEDNLVCRAGKVYKEAFRRGYGRWPYPTAEILLEKHIPDGAGIGGGSADAAFTLRLLNEFAGYIFNEEELANIALRVGADCPFFIYNRPMYGEGIGEVLSDIELDLSGYWLLLVKPNVYVSTKEAFAGIKPHEAVFNLREIASLPIEKWQGLVTNDFEASIFPAHPELKDIKRIILEMGAVYASMSGSGSSIYGIFKDKTRAEAAAEEWKSQATIEGAYLLEL